MVRTLVSGLTAAAIAGAVSAFAQDEAAAAGDPVVGERVFAQCRTCHVFDPEARRQGPHLLDIFGRTAGAVDGFRYSDAMLESGIVWDEDNLGPYLLDPRGVMPGTSMLIGLRRETDLPDLMAYLREAAAGE